MKKRCPRCGGNIYLEEDSYGGYEHCLQCGYDCDLKNIIESPGQAVLSTMNDSSVLNDKKPTSPKVIPELWERHLVAQLKQD